MPNATNYLVNKVLVVEDNDLFREIAKHLFKQLNIAIDIVSCGSNAIAIAHAYNLVFLDLGLPDINGVEVCKRIREQTDKPQPTIIMLTAHINKELRERSMTAGANDFISKPVEQAELLRIIKKYSNKK